MSRPYHGDGADGIQYVPPSAGLEHVQPDLEVTNGYYGKVDYHSHAPELVRKLEGKQVAGTSYYGGDTEKEIVPPTKKQTIGRRICGVNARTFWILLVVVMIVIIVAIAVGVRSATATRSSSSMSPPPASTPTNSPQVTTTSSQASAQSSSQSPSLTASQTSSTALPSGVLAVPSFNGFWNGVPEYTATLTYTAAPAGATSGITNIDCPKSNDTMYISSTGEKYMKQCYIDIAPSANTDLNHVIVYSLNDCIDTCSVWNSQSNSGKKCKSVSYSADLSVSLGPGGPGKNCHLKSVIGPLSKSRFPVAGAILSS